MSRDWLVFGEDWGGHPSTLMHIVRTAIEQGQVNRVIWVNSLGLRSPRFDRRDARRLLSKALGLLTGRAAVKDTTWQQCKPSAIIHPMCLPFWDVAWVAKLNGFLLARQIKKAYASLSIASPDVITNMVTCQPVLQHLRYRKLIYYCQDDFSSFPEVNHAMASHFEQQLCQMASSVVVVSDGLAKKLASYKPCVLPQGVDVAFFSRPQSVGFPYQSPVIGYWGMLDAWVDLDCLHRIATKLSEATFLIIGEIKGDASSLQALPNVHCLGKVPYGQLPAYGQKWDVSLAIYNDEVASIASSAPVKIWEYVALGKPAVVSDVSVCRTEGLDRYLSYAKTPDEFVLAIRQCLQNADSFVSGVDYLRQHHSWQKRLEVLLGLL